MTWFGTFLTSCTDEAGGDLAVVDGDFFLSDEEVDLTGPGVLHSRHEVFADAQIVLRCDVGRLRRRGAGDGAGSERTHRDARRDGGHRSGRTGLLEEHSPADFFH